jgi:hypothetical protein
MFSRVARITGMSHWCLAYTLCFIQSQVCWGFCELMAIPEDRVGKGCRRAPVALFLNLPEASYRRATRLSQLL